MVMQMDPPAVWNLAPSWFDWTCSLTIIVVRPRSIFERRAETRAVVARRDGARVLQIHDGCVDRTREHDARVPLTRSIIVGQALRDVVAHLLQSVVHALDDPIAALHDFLAMSSHET